MNIENNTKIEIDEFWAKDTKKIDSSTLELTDEQIHEVTDAYKIEDAHSFYLHTFIIVNIWYHSKLGEPLINLFDFSDTKINYNIDCDDD